METRNEKLWQELIESKDFIELSSDEKTFVLSYSSEDNYKLERAVLVESKLLYHEDEPRSLILSHQKKGIVIPLYQTIIAAAAAFVLAFLLFRSSTSPTEIVKNQILANTDTVYVEKLIIDTVIQTKTEYVQTAAKMVTSDIKPSTSPCESAPSVLSNEGSFEADLRATTLANKGMSARNDATIVLMENWVTPN